MEARRKIEESNEVPLQPLLKLLGEASAGLAKKDKGAVPGSSSFHFAEGHVRTFNDNIHVSVPVPELSGVAATVPAEALLELLKKLTDDNVTVEQTKTELIFSSGRVRSGITIQDGINLPEVSWDDKGKESDLPETFGEAMRFAMYACASDLANPILKNVHIRPGRLEGTDNFRATIYNLPHKLRIKGSVLISADIVEEAVKRDFAKCQQSEDGVWFHLQTKEGIVFSCRTSLGKYPDIEVDTEGNKVFELKGTEIRIPPSMGDVMERVLVFAHRDYFFDEMVQVTLGKKRLKVRADSSEGWIEEEVNLNYNGDEHTFWVHPQFLKDMVPRAQSCIVGKDSLLFEGDTWSHIVALTEPKK